MARTSQEELMTEKAFTDLLGERADMFFRLADTLVRHKDSNWGRRHYFQLIVEADTAEAFFDDHGARYNRTFRRLVEITASARGFAIAGLRMAHLRSRIDSYVERLLFSQDELGELKISIERAIEFIRSSTVILLSSALEEAQAQGTVLSQEGFPSDRYESVPVQQVLPRNVGHQDLDNEEQKVAEVASKFIHSCEMLDEMGIHRIDDSDKRERFLAVSFSEESARVFQATVHNLQSAYDTYIRNTAIEAGDERLLKLRGHASGALHFLEAVTALTHFVERHEGARGSEEDVGRPTLIKRDAVRRITLNDLLYWGNEFMQKGRSLAEELLPVYTNVQELSVVVQDDVTLHARPASLIVGIVSRYGTPVEMLVGEESCNAGSMLSLMVLIGSNATARGYVFRGDERPLRDISRLFECGLGEGGMDTLPEDLDYLRKG